MSANTNCRDDQLMSEAAWQWSACPTCHGLGKVQRPTSRKARARHKRARLQQQQVNGNRSEHNHSLHIPERWDGCRSCQGSGLTILDSSDSSATTTTSKETMNGPRVAVVGGGLAGLALAAACRHRGIKCTVYERDSHWQERHQGYGLTMQQAAKALAALGIAELQEGITSTRHVVHTANGTVVGEWGLRKWAPAVKQKQKQVEEARRKSSGVDENNPQSPLVALQRRRPKRQNVHIARQALRFQLLQQATAGGIQPDVVQWNYRLVSYDLECPEKKRVQMVFEVDKGKRTVERSADLLVGADGIRSCVRQQLIGDDKTPLKYLGCIVILGICSLADLSRLSSGGNLPPLLDGETVFQTADGTTRIYVMPYSSTACMWQLSFPLEETVAVQWSQQGPDALKEHALQRCGEWHAPVPDVIQATSPNLISGYPVYDRELLTDKQLHAAVASDNLSAVTLIGDAAHPMSPFKGQGANQALLDALGLARAIYSAVQQPRNKEESQSLSQAARSFEKEMLARTAPKVQASQEAARFLHTPVAIRQGNITRGAASRQGEDHAADTINHSIL